MMSSRFSLAFASLLVLGLTYLPLAGSMNVLPVPADVLPAISADSGYGSTVVMTPSRLFVGAPDHQTDSGMIAMYHRNKLMWSLNGANDENLGRQFSVALDGSRLAVPRLGAVFVYNLGDSGISGLVGQPIIQNVDGSSISVLSPDGTRLAVSDLYDEDELGRVTIYSLSDDESEWILEAELIGDDVVARFGNSICFSSNGQRIAIAAANQNVNGSQRNGLVRIFEWNESAWSSIGEDLEGDGDRDQFGLTMALSGSGDTLIVGAENSAGNGIFQGSIKIFVYADGSWKQTSYITGANDFDRFGHSVAINHDGSLIAAASYFHRAQRGHVRLFKLVSGNWEPALEIEGENVRDRIGGGRLGLSLLPDGSGFAVGATGFPLYTGVIGQVLVYHLEVAVSSAPTVAPSIMSPSSVPSDVPSSLPSLRPSSYPSADQRLVVRVDGTSGTLCLSAMISAFIGVLGIVIAF